MALAKGVEDSFGRGLSLGSDIVSGFLKSKLERKQKEKERLDELVKNNPDLFTPMSYQAALGQIEKTGAFNLPQESPGTDLAQNGIAGVGGLTSKPPASNFDSGPRFGARKEVTVDSVLATAYPELASLIGQTIPSEVLKEVTKKSRADIYAEGQKSKTEAIIAGQGERQKTSIEEENKKENRDFYKGMAKAAYLEYLKAKQFGTEDTVREDVATAFELAGYPAEEVERFRVKEMEAEEEDGWLSKLFGKKSKPPVKEKKVETQPEKQETETRKKNPETGKWWVFKGNKWQEE